MLQRYARIELRPTEHVCASKADSKGPAMTRQVVYCFEDQDTEEAERVMEKKASCASNSSVPIPFRYPLDRMSRCASSIF